MKRHLYEVWKEPSFHASSRMVWRLQAKGGIDTFRTKRDAVKVAETISGRKYWEISYEAQMRLHAESGMRLG